jgi:AdoMet-dependent heme synthase
MTANNESDSEQIRRSPSHTIMAADAGRIPEVSSSHRTPSVRRPRIDLAQRPFIVIWEITRACDLACAHCRAEANPHAHPDELSGAEARELIDQVADFGQPWPLLILTGGDPMKRRDLSELISYATARHLPVALSPSATPLLTAGLISELRGAGLKALSLSVDGAGPLVHDAFRGIDGVFERTMQAWEAANECGLKVQINTTAVRSNLVELPGVARLVLERGAMLWSVFFLVPVGRGVKLEQISAAECEDVMNFLYDTGRAIRVKTTEGHHFRRIVLERTILERRGIAPETVLRLGATYRALRSALEPWPSSPRERRSPMDVNAGRGLVFVSHTGAVHPSGFLPITADNVRARSLGEIYRESPLFKSLRDITELGGRCGRCEFAGVCGGSRARAFAVGGDALAEDPLCAYTPGTFRFQADLGEPLAGTAAEATT